MKLLCSNLFPLDNTRQRAKYTSLKSDFYMNVLSFVLSVAGSLTKTFHICMSFQWLFCFVHFRHVALIRLTDMIYMQNLLSSSEK